MNACAEPGVDEPAAIRRRRLTMRSWRRGMREMDLILGPFANARLGELSGAELDAFERLLAENDQDLYSWVSGARPAPATHEDILTIIAGFHGIHR